MKKQLFGGGGGGGSDYVVVFSAKHSRFFHKDFFFLNPTTEGNWVLFTSFFLFQHTETNNVVKSVTENQQQNETAGRACTENEYLRMYSLHHQSLSTHISVLVLFLDSVNQHAALPREVEGTLYFRVDQLNVIIFYDACKRNMQNPCQYKTI